MSLLERALHEVRTLFRPPGFERRDLGAIMKGLTVQHEAMTDQPLELSLDEELGDCPLPAKIALYRILQEALWRSSVRLPAARRWSSS